MRLEKKLQAGPCLFGPAYRCVGRGRHWHPITPVRDRGEHTTLASCDDPNCSKTEHWHLLEATHA